jgi:hypothetical protein
LKRCGARRLSCSATASTPLEILSGYRTPASNQKLREAGVPAARQSLHMVGRAADIRIANLNAEVLGGLVKSFRQGGVGFYYRAGPRRLDPRGYRPAAHLEGLTGGGRQLLRSVASTSCGPAIDYTGGE